MAGNIDSRSSSSPPPNFSQSDVPLLSDVEVGYEDGEKTDPSLSSIGMVGRTHRFHGAPLQTGALMEEILSPHSGDFNSPTSPTQWPASAKEPLLPGDEGIRIDNCNVEVVEPPPKTKTPYISAEYRLALSHFRVSIHFTLEFCT